MVITGSAKLVVTLKTTAFSVHSCLTQNVISLLRGIPFKWSLEHNFCLTSLTSSPSGIISGFGSACVFNLTSFSWDATLVSCQRYQRPHVGTHHYMSSCSQLSLWLNSLQLSHSETNYKTRPSWLNCALRGDEAVYWVRIWQQWLALGGIESVKGGTG